MKKILQKLILAITLVTITGNLFAQDASFTMSQNSGCQPLAVHFENTTPNAAYTYWYFSDGNSDTDYDMYADNTFYGAGTTHSVTMYAYDANWNFLGYASDYITLSGNDNYFYMSEYTVCPNQDVNFYYYGGGANHSWDFGDGFVENGSSNVLHSYTNSGTYLVTLTFDGTCGSQSIQNYITIDNTLTPYVSSYSNPSSVCPGQNISFNSYGSGVTYSWDFGDGNTAVGNYVNHIYTTGGNYNVITTTQNSCGNYGSTSLSITVGSGAPFGNISISSNDSATCPGAQANFNTMWGNQKYVWNYGDGSPEYNAGGSSNGYHTYLNAGTYDVSVVITNFCGVDTTLHLDYEVRTDLPISSGSAYIGGSQNLCPGQAANFNTSGSMATYTWDFGDGSAIQTYAPNQGGSYVYHEFQNTGTYNVSVNFSNFCGSDTTLYYNISIVDTNKITNAYVGSSSEYACPNTPISFYGPWDVKLVEWNFGDGSPMLSTTQSYVNHIYPNLGMYTISARFVNYCDFDTIVYKNIYIVDSLQMSNNYSLYPNKTNICPGENINFWVSGSGNNMSYVYDFGDGSPKDSVQYSGNNHNFENLGIYNISVRIYDYCGNYKDVDTTINVISTQPITGYVGVWNSSGDVCVGDMVNFSTYDGYASYEWNFGDGTVINGESYEGHNYASVGNYTVTLKITNSCGFDTTISAMANVTSNASINAWSINLNMYPNKICPGEIASISAADGFAMYIWDYNDGTANDTTYNNQVMHAYANPGEYTPKVTVFNSCGNSAQSINGGGMGGNQSVIVDNNNAVSNISANTMSSSYCPGDDIEIYVGNGQDNYSYEYNFGDGSANVTSNNNTESHSYAATGVYTVTVTATNSCGNSNSTTTSIVVDNNAMPELGNNFGIAGGDAYAGCPGDEILFYFMGTSDNVWDFGDGTSESASEQLLAGDGNTIITIIRHTYANAGSYNATLTITNSCGNSTSGTTEVNIGSGLPADGDIFVELPVSGEFTTCVPVKIIAVGGSTYSWSFGDGSTQVSSIASMEHVYNQPGDYVITVEITNGCGNRITVDRMITVSGTGGAAVSLNQMTPASCSNSSDGSVSVNIVGGQAPYSYNWSNGQTSDVATGLAAGVYNVVVTDAFGCEGELVVSVSSAPALVAGLVSSTPASCNVNDGTLEVSVSNGSGNYSYLWSNGQNSSIASGLAAQMYTLLVTDLTSSCSESFGFEVNNANAPMVSASTVNNVTCSGLSNGSIEITAISGGSGNETYSWSNGDVGASISNLEAGSYMLTLTDAAGCMSVSMYEISQPSEISLNGSATGTDCHSATGTASVVVSGGSTPYTYLWSEGSTNNSQSGLAPGTVNVDVTDANGCYATLDIEVPYSGAPNIAQSNTEVTCNAGTDGRIEISLSGGVGPFTVIWPTLAKTGKIVNNVAAGTYIGQIMDGNGCFTFVTVSIPQPDAIAITNTSTDEYCELTDGVASVSVTGGTSPYTYTWTGDVYTSSISNVNDGTYSITVKDVNSCSATANIIVGSEANNMNVSLTASPSICGQNNGSVDNTVTGGYSPYTYLWSNSATSEDLTGVADGYYTVIVTDSKGCVAGGTNSTTITTAIAAQDICVVTVDSYTNNSIVVWQKTYGMGTANFNIYREGTVANQFDYLATVPFDSLSEYVDITSDNVARSYRYKISALDSCSNESVLSTHHKTFRITASASVIEPGAVDFNLVDAYEGAFFGSYVVYVGASNADSLMAFDTIPSNLLSYTLYDYPQPANDTLVFMVEQVGGPNCTASRAKNFNASRSNTANLRYSSLVSARTLARNEASVEVYPNPNSGKFEVALTGLNNQSAQIRIMDLKGSIVFENTNVLSEDVSKFNLDLNSYSKGIYTLQVQTEKGNFVKKIVVQ